MRIPNAEQAVVDIAKLLDYCLNPDHLRGRHKARVFASVLGLTSEHAEDLRRQLLAAVRDAEATEGEKDGFGARYGHCSTEIGFMLARPRPVKGGHGFPSLGTLPVAQQVQSHAADDGVVRPHAID